MYYFLSSNQELVNEKSLLLGCVGIQALEIVVVCMLGFCHRRIHLLFAVNYQSPEMIVS